MFKGLHVVLNSGSSPTLGFCGPIATWALQEWEKHHGRIEIGTLLSRYSTDPEFSGGVRLLAEEDFARTVTYLSEIGAIREHSKGGLGENTSSQAPGRIRVQYDATAFSRGLVTLDESVSCSDVYVDLCVQIRNMLC